MCHHDMKCIKLRAKQATPSCPSSKRNPALIFQKLLKLFGLKAKRTNSLCRHFRYLQLVKSVVQQTDAEIFWLTRVDRHKISHVMLFEVLGPCRIVYNPIDNSGASSMLPCSHHVSTMLPPPSPLPSEPAEPSCFAWPHGAIAAIFLHKALHKALHKVVDSVDS